MKRALGSLSVAVALAGCCNCDARREDGPRRPGDVVRDLREAVTGKRWEQAALCFSEDVRAKNAGAMRSGEFAWPLAPGTTLVSVEIRGDEAVATLEPRGELVIQKSSRGEWLVADWR